MKHALPLPLFWFGEEKQSPEYFVRYRKILHNLYDADKSVLVPKIEELYALSSEYMNDKNHNVEDRIEVRHIRWKMEDDLPQMPDPAKEAEYKFWWDHWVKADMLKEDYERVESMTPENLREDEYKKKELKRLECELEAMEAALCANEGETLAG